MFTRYYNIFATIQKIEITRVIAQNTAGGLGARLFEGVEWSSERVLAQTVALAEGRGLGVVYLPERFDVDSVGEFEWWRGRV